MSDDALPYFSMEELRVVFGYSSERGVRAALDRGTLNIPTFKIRGRRYAHAAVVAAFFDKQKAEGLAELSSEPSAQ